MRDGRLKDMIIRGGENIYPADLEVRLLEHSDIVNVTVIGADHDGGRLCARPAELLRHDVLHADETPVAMLKPGAGKTRANRARSLELAVRRIPARRQTSRRRHEPGPHGAMPRTASPIAQGS